MQCTVNGINECKDDETMMTRSLREVMGLAQSHTAAEVAGPDLELRPLMPEATLLQCVLPSSYLYYSFHLALSACPSMPSHARLVYPRDYGPLGRRGNSIPKWSEQPSVGPKEVRLGSEFSLNHSTGSRGNQTQPHPV